MQRLKRYRVLVVVALLVAAYFGWRLSRPPLTPEQQIRANMNDVTQAMRNTSPRGILGYLSPDFKWNRTGRDEVEHLIREASAGATNVQVTRSGEQIQVRGDEATASGDFSLSYRMLQESRETAPHVVKGQYSVLWQKQNGEWKITQIQGGENGLNNAPNSEPMF